MNKTYWALMPAVFLFLVYSGCAKKVAVVKPPDQPVRASVPAQSRPALAQTPRRSEQPVRTVAAAKSSSPDKETRAQIQELLNRIQDAYFDYNTQNIRADAMVALKADAQTLSTILKDYPDYKLTVEGFCDERGSDEYNLGLGDARAKRAKAFLVDSGIPDGQLKTVSFGKERPVCEEHNEACWQKNRRVHITQAQS